MHLVSVSWVLHQPGVVAAILGARTPAQIRELTVAADLSLEPEIIQKLTDATELVKQALETNPDMWMSESRFR